MRITTFVPRTVLSICVNIKTFGTQPLTTKLDCSPSKNEKKKDTKTYTNLTSNKQFAKEMHLHSTYM